MSRKVLSSKKIISIVIAICLVIPIIFGVVWNSSVLAEGAFVDSNNSNVDGSVPPDIGNETDFVNCQDTSPDSDYMYIQENDTGGAGVDEDRYVDTCPSLVTWTSGGSTPYLDAVDTTNYITATGNAALSVWIEFGETSGTGSGFTVNMEIYADNTDEDEDIYWELDWTDDGVADASGTWSNVPATPQWYDAGTISGLDMQTEIDACRIRFQNIKGGGGPGTTTIDAARLDIIQTGTNYTIDFEYTWTAADHDEPFEEVCFYTGTKVGTENLTVSYWTGSVWSPLGTIFAENAWTNFTATGLASQYYTIRLNGTLEDSDTTQGNWSIDCILLNTHSSWWDTNWDHFRTITIDSSKIGTNLENFPLLIVFDNSSFHVDSSNSIRFTAGSNSGGTENVTEYNYEIEKWDDSGNCYVWVNVTEVYSGSDTIFNMYYNNSGVADGQDITGTWDSNYICVHHMNDSTTSTILDSTSNDNDGTKDSANQPVEANAVIGKGQSWSGSYHIGMSDTDFNIQPDLTVEAWIKVPDTADYRIIYSRCGTPVHYHTTSWRLNNDGTLNVQWENPDGTSHVLMTVAEYDDDTWQHTVLAVDSKDVSIYVAGSLVAHTADIGDVIPSYTTGTITMIGTVATYTDVQPFNGVMDEFRISDITRNSSWINASFHSQNQTTGFLTIGAEQEYIGGWVNTASTITSPNPSNQSTGVSLQPTVNVTITDMDGNQSTCRFYTSTDGSNWVHRQVNTSVLNESIEYVYTQATGYNTTYYWKVSANDIHDNVSASYYFETGGIIISNEKPSNESTGISLVPWLNITVGHMDDDNGVDMNVTFRTNVTGSWSDINTNSSVGNGTYRQTNDSMNEEGTKYWWSVNVSDGHGTWSNNTFSYTTIIKVTETVGVVACILEFNATSISDTYRIYYGESSGITTGDNATYIDPPDCSYGDRIARKMIIDGLTEEITYYYRIYDTGASSWHSAEDSFTTLPRFTNDTGLKDEFFDTYLIDASSGISIAQQVGTKDTNNPLITHTYGSQPNGIGYLSVVNDSGTWRLWATNCSNAATEIDNNAYFTSTDGVSWTYQNDVGVTSIEYSEKFYSTFRKVADTYYALFKRVNSKGCIASCATPGGTYTLLANGEDCIDSNDVDGNEAVVCCFFNDTYRCNTWWSSGQGYYVGASNIREPAHWIGFNFTDWLSFDRAYYPNIEATMHEGDTYTDQCYEFPVQIKSGVYVGIHHYYNGSSSTGIIEPYLVVSRNGTTFSITDDNTMIVPLGGTGTWDDCMIFTNRREIITVGDYDYLYYNAWDNVHESSTRTTKVGRIIFRKDGLTALEPSGSSDWFRTKAISQYFVGNFTINGNFSSSNKLNISVLYASNDTVMSEFDYSDFTTITTSGTSIMPSWGSKNLSYISNEDFKLNFSFDGADGQLFSYSITEGKHLADTTPPEIIINFAGNLSDSGGPYWRPPGESTQLTGVWSDGYYTNNSRQSEDWIHINITANDSESSVTDVWLQWLNETTWTNWTYAFANTVGEYWEYNTSGNIQTCEGYNYSFNIVANSTGGSTTTWWNKTIDNSGIIRRTVQLNCTPANISYTPYYFHHQEYTNTLKYDILHHDQGTQGSNHDVGYLLDTMPSGTEVTYCGTWIGFWFDHSISNNVTDVNNIYFHNWWATDNNYTSFAGYRKTREDVDSTLNEYYSVDESEERSSVFYENNIDGWSSYYHLDARLFDVSSFSGLTDNNIYEYFIGFQCAALHSLSIINNKNLTSFVLFNVPDNATLNASHADNDSDGLSDWNELYVHYTNPFIADTDNDGINDYWEVQAGSDPNNFSSVTTYVDDNADAGWYDALHVRTIQEGIDNVTSGATVYVWNGTYNENVIVNKTISIIGNGSSVVTVDAGGTLSAINVTAEWVNVSGVRANNSGTVFFDNAGIIVNANYTNISHCNSSSNGADGILISNLLGFNVHNVSIYNCTIYSNADDGIMLIMANNCDIVDNIIRSNTDDAIYPCWVESHNNSIHGNNCTNNNHSIYISYAKDNTIYNNYFGDPALTSNDGGNIWNVTKASGTNIIGGAYLGGNYWSDYTGCDLNGDGLGDTDIPHNCSGNITIGGDYHPLTESLIIWIDVTNASWDLGNIVMDSSTWTNETGKTFIADMDNCTVNTDLKLQVTNDGADWSAATSGNGPGADIYRLNASIDSWVTEFQIVTASVTTISLDIVAGQNETFDLRFDAPTSSSTGNQQGMTITATLVEH